jgi:hypothetical protein
VDGWANGDVSVALASVLAVMDRLGGGSLWSLGASLAGYAAALPGKPFCLFHWDVDLDM